MGTGREFEGKDLDQALRAASEALGAPPGELDYEVLAEGRRGVFGLGARSVRIWVDMPPPARQAHSASSPAQHHHQQQMKAPADTRWVEETLDRMFALMGLVLKIRTSGAGGGVRVELGGPDRRLLLARDGELLSALQCVLSRMARRAQPGAGRIQIECEGHQNRRDEELIELVREVAEQVSRTGQSRWLHPMNPYERRLAHVTVREIPGLTSRSEGTGFLKKVEVTLSEPRGRA